MNRLPEILSWAMPTVDLNIYKLELNCVKNNTEHHTLDIAVDRLIVRRGQSFLLTFYAARALNPEDDFLEFIVETGPDASEDKGTRSVFNLKTDAGNGGGKQWSVKIEEIYNTWFTASVYCPAEASIGRYALSLRTGSASSDPSNLGNILVLFNPWCEQDWVYLADEAERQEYVMDEQGTLYRGIDRYITTLAWDYGQFEPDILDICLTILDKNPKCLENAQEDFSARCNPIYVGRVISAMINSQDDRGLLVGGWGDSFIGGLSPDTWTGSLDIIRKWFKYGCHPVKYGQCWVFAGVMVTVLRCLGIPCRAITNFKSAHDTNQNLIVDEYYSDYGVRPKKSPDSVWNYHVWVEAWMKRPDLSDSSYYDGWQVLDPTPQEKSTGVFCCGPAPVRAVLEGHTEAQYDVPFVFAEVNADLCSWLLMAKGKKKKIFSDIATVGQNISTKAVGEERVDITASYKYPEGSEKERSVFKEAVHRNNMMVNGDTKSKVERPDVSMKISLDGPPVRGVDIKLITKLHSDHPEPLNLSIHMTAQVMRYTGLVIKDIWSDQTNIKLLPNQDQSFPLCIPMSSYSSVTESMLGSSTIKVTVVATDTEDQENSYLTHRDIVLETPTIDIKVTGTPIQYRNMYAEVTFENPLSVPLKDCVIMLMGSGLLRAPEESRYPVLAPGQKVTMRVNFRPFRAGPKGLAAYFSCPMLGNITSSYRMNILPSISFSGVLY